MNETRPTPTPESTPDAADAPYRCDICGGAYPTETLLIHHRGVRHPDELSETELDQYRDAYEEEESQLRRFRIVALGGIVLLYFGFLFMYAIFAL
ncbi:hypothetical protein SAMN04487948_109118 [Halogranum amylolyticum]|uniref:C2H2-type domain-containing protein n=1 Tax=Halogranum amylolyticum TaxID=660520 RepID=A0A1H8U3I8_9EURY|nr:DNA-binding protein [Halogranum amylolyticum]SEO97842.1 hypothetical protein SAMN04487948_109118 [Halogranum amylolyticum]